MRGPPLLLGLIVALSVCSNVVSFATRDHGTRKNFSVRFVDGQNMAGGSRHLLGDILRSLQPRYLGQVAEAVQSNIKGQAKVNVDSFVTSLDIPSWEEIQEMLTKQQTPVERNFRQKLQQGEIGSALADFRLFGQSKPVVTLYRDSAAWCPYCQKVWIALEEKQVPYEVVRIDMRCYGKGKPTEFLKLQPSGNLPCAVVNGRVVNESNDIIDLLDELGSPGTPRLRPKGGSDEAARVSELCDNGRQSLERRLYSQWMWWLTGVRRPAEYKQNMEEVLDEVDEALKAAPRGGPYFMGKDVSLVDIRFIPFVERQIASLAYFKGYDVRDALQRPFLARWLQAMESRPSYLITKSDWYTHSRALPPQLAADCAVESGSEQLQDCIDYLPVGQTFDTEKAEAWLEPGWEWNLDTEKGRREAVERLVFGHQRIVRFACRGAGTAGLPAAAAPLADPLATPNEAIVPAVDAMIRLAALNLLRQNGTSRFPSLPKEELPDLSASIDNLDESSADAIAACLDYLRARIGVPRDMSYGAATELRKELFRLSDTIRRPGQRSSGKMKDVPQAITAR